MNFKTLLIATSLLTLIAACVPAEPSGATGGGGGRPVAGEDEFCGGIAGIQCEPGLVCEYEGTYPDAGGRCIRK